MSIRHIGLALIVALAASTLHATDVNKTNCNLLNYSNPVLNYAASNPTEHSTGNHYWNNSQIPSCSYTSLAQTTTRQGCVALSQVTSVSNAYESGNTPGVYHTPTMKDKSGAAYGAAGATAVAGAMGAADVHSCLAAPCDSAPITISGNAAGIGLSISIPAGERVPWSDDYSSTNTCTAYYLTAKSGGGSSSCPVATYPPPYVQQGFVAVWNTATCSWNIVPSGESPIFVDTKGNNWQTVFTDPKKGEYVTFRVNPAAPPMRVSWPRHGTGVGMLVRDDGTGIVKDGGQAFGNFTIHANSDYTGVVSSDPNGISALAWWDQRSQGGNVDTNITNQDAVWSSLRIWIDEHCYKNRDQPCQSDPSELHHLEEFDIYAISLAGEAAQLPQGLTEIVCPSWQKSIGFCDAVGNEFRFQTVINPLSATNPRDAQGRNQGERKSNDLDVHGKDRKRMAYDVWFMALPVN